MDDALGTFTPRITAYRTAIMQNSSLGVEAAEALREFGYAFGHELNKAAQKVDMTLPEARKYRAAWEDLRDEFEAFMSLVPMSNALQLVDLASQVSEFAAKLEALPPVRRRQPMMQKSEHLPPDQSVQAGITA